MSRIDYIVRLMKQYECQSYAEIGVKKGRMLSGVLKQTGATGLGVDPFKAVPNEREDYAEWDFDAIRLECVEAIAGLPVELWPGTSLAAANYCALTEQSFDLVFIDAGHDYENVKQDIELWAPLTNKVISGHDYNNQFPGVMQAVDELVPDRLLAPHSIWWNDLNEGRQEEA